MKKIILYTFILLCTSKLCLGQERISGKLLDSGDRQPLMGASVKIRGTNIGVVSNSKGLFSMILPSKDAVLVISFLGYKTEEVSVTLPLKEVLIIELQKDVGTLQEVVVSTGYQVLPKERATGSFVRVDNELLNRKVSTDLISRLEDVVPGLVKQE